MTSGGGTRRRASPPYMAGFPRLGFCDLDFQAVLKFWFSLDSPGKRHDTLVTVELGPGYRRAAAGELDGWRENPRSRLALILLLDQVPRHIHRERPGAFATDLPAQACTAIFFARRDWDDLSPFERFYMAHPWLHAEDAALQEVVNPFLRDVAGRLPGLEYMAGIAELYLETIRRFGRFPHRNRILGRASTAAEEAFLKEEWFARRREIRQAQADCPASRWLPSAE